MDNLIPFDRLKKARKKRAQKEQANRRRKAQRAEKAKQVKDAARMEARLDAEFSKVLAKLPFSDAFLALCGSVGRDAFNRVMDEAAGNVMVQIAKESRRKGRRGKKGKKR